MRFAPFALFAFTVCALHAADPSLLPEGDTGLAANYPGDEKLAQDPEVVFSEDFEEESIAALGKRYESARQPEETSFSSDVPKGSAGKQSWFVNHKAGSGPDLWKILKNDQNGYDQLFLRYYLKIDQACSPFHHGPVMWGGFTEPTPWPKGTAGRSPTGEDHFIVAAEMYGDWHWDFYNYWATMRACPDGSCWGNDLINDHSWSVAKDTWICVEQMIKLNTVGDSDGESAIWIDGKLWRDKNGQVLSHLGKGFPKGKWVWDSFTPDPAGEPFEGFVFRKTEKLRINTLWPQVYMDKFPPGTENKVWYDHFVVAKKYIGPLKPKE